MYEMMCRVRQQWPAALKHAARQLRLLCMDHCCCTRACICLHACVLPSCMCVVCAVWKKGFLYVTDPWLALHKHVCILMYAGTGGPACSLFSCALFIRRDLSLSSARLRPRGAWLSPRAGPDFRPPAFCHTPLAPLSSGCNPPHANPTHDSFSNGSTSSAVVHAAFLILF